jgi:signal transduction histidine kinase
MQERKEGRVKETDHCICRAIAAARMGAWDWNVSDNVLYWDDGMASLYGMKRTSFPRTMEAWQALLHDDDLAKVRDALAAAMRGEREFDTEFRVTGAGGTVRVIKADGLVFRDGAGSAIRMIGLNRDITEQRWIEHEIMTMNEQLEYRIAERTAQLEQTNKNLREEIDDRMRIEETLKHYTAELRSFSSQLMATRESERRHIAHELHDAIGQELTGLKLSVARIARSVGPDTALQLNGVQREIESLMLRVRDLSSSLRPPILDDLGLFPALSWHFGRYTEQTGVNVDFVCNGGERRFPAPIETVMFRVVQEALTNGARHAGVDRVNVDVNVADHEVSAVIEDRGRGFDPEAVLKSGKTLGLVWIRERIEDAGGKLNIDSAPGRGTRLYVTLPLPAC